MRFIGLLRADADSEAGAPPDPDLMARMGDFRFASDLVAVRPFLCGRSQSRRPQIQLRRGGPFVWWDWGWCAP